MADHVLPLGSLSGVEYDWCEVHSEYQGHAAVFQLFRDALQLGGVRVVGSAAEVQALADQLDALLPTPRLLDLRFQQAEVSAPPSPKYYENGVGMDTRDAITEHSARVERWVRGQAGSVANVGKHWVLHEKMSDQKAVLYGWHVDDDAVQPSAPGTAPSWNGIKLHPATSPGLYVIQPISAAHNHKHFDYAMTVLLLRGTCVVDGVTRRTEEVLTDPTLCGLAVAEGRPLTRTRVGGPKALPPGAGAVGSGGTSAVPPGSASGVEPTRPTLRRGSRGSTVQLLQTRLVSLGLSLAPYGADGDFGLVTDLAVRQFQRSIGLKDDGVVGPKTWERLFSPGAAAPPAPPPTRAVTLRPLTTNAERHQLFGNFTFEAIPGTDGAVRIHGSWVQNNIVTVHVPQLARIPGVVYRGRLEGAGPRSGMVQCHRLIAGQLLQLWAAWEQAGLLDRVLTWAGLWVPRFSRGSSTTLSNHAFGTAFDINAPWNALGATVAPRGTRGSVEELVPIANDLGWFWGGDFRSRPDGMHFEVAVIK